MSATAMLQEAAQIAEEAPLIPMPSLAAALVAALADLTIVVAEQTAKIPMKSGGEFSYKYADIADVVKLTRPVLAAHGIIALTPVHGHGDGLACTVILLHTSGERMDLGPFPFPHGRDAQATGSMVTYHRRYALVAALGMAAGDDDDGAAAAPRQAAAAPKQSAQAKAVLDLLAKLPADDAERLGKDCAARSGVPLHDALELDDWRAWLTSAIEHHLKEAQ